MKSLSLLSLVIAPFSVHAADAGPAVPPAAALGGTAIPGLCMLSRPAVFANAKVGVAATARLRVLAQQADAELAPDRKALDTERQAFGAQEAKLSPADRQTRGQALEQHALALQKKTQLLNREIEATREKALGRIATEMQPIVAQAYKAHGCGLLVDRNAVLGGNMANDLTAAAVQGLDARITTISFDRETLSQ